MQAYALALSYAIPGFILLVIVEAIVSRFRGIAINRAMDTISSLSSGITNTLKSLIGLSVVILSYDWMVDKVAIFDIQKSWVLYLMAFIGLDFAGYWSHRFNHVVNLLWNRHIVHHSSEEFNLSCALRQPISSIVVIYFFLYIPMAIVGVPAQVVAIVAPIHFFAQFWYHTRLINKMGFLEYIIVTPSHHRVHHAINKEYLDKNFSEIFIIWDKLFGSFQKELEEVPPVYGTKKPVRTWNPIWINYLHLWLLIKDAWRTKSWWDKLRIWFMPTGWRPKDVINAYPIEIIDDVYHREKYDTPASDFFIGWSWIQLVVTLGAMYYLLIHIADFPFFNVILITTLLMVSIFAYTTLMDGHYLAIPVELVKLTLGFYLILNLFGSEAVPGVELSQNVLILTGSYLVLSFLLTAYFLYEQKNRNPAHHPAT